MKKNISINISGIIFHIEEDGYDTLKKYLDSINKYFSAFEDSSEILADIESRIAEIFLSKLNEEKQVITTEDVHSLVTTMGSVSDFKAAEEQEPVASSTGGQSKTNETGSFNTESNASENKSYALPKQLRRDQQRKFLGGVCAGLGNYFNIDPLWIRLIFALLLFAYGFTFFVYIIMWIVVPGSFDLEEPIVSKKMYRDPERKVIAGVAGGVAAYLGIDIIAVRVLFIVLSIAGGIGFFLYIILWLILPEARTITDKMQMQGEPVTLSNIESTIKKNLNVKEGEQESTLTKILLFPFRLIGMILTGIGKLLVPVVEIIRVAIGIVIVLIGVSLLFSVVVSAGILFGLFSISSFSVPGLSDISDVSVPVDAFLKAFPGWTAFAAFVASAIPSVLIIMLGSSVIAKRIVFNAAAGWTLFVLFFISVAMLAVGIPKIVYAFKEEGEYKVENVYKISGKTAVLKVNEVGMDDYHATNLTIKNYDGKDFKLVKTFKAQGSTRAKAIENAKMVDYNVDVKDSVFVFDSNLKFRDNAVFRAQHLSMTLYVPDNAEFTMDESFSRFITHYIDREYLDGYRWKVIDNQLECIDCPKTENNTLSDLRDFDELEITGKFDVRITHGYDFAVELVGPETEKDKYKIYRSGQTLIIDFEGKKKVDWTLKDLNIEEMRINITMPELNKIEATGFGDIRIQDFTCDNLEIEMRGPVHIRGNINAQNLSLSLTGKSEAEFTGNVNKLDARLEFASKLRAYNLEVTDAFIEASGASSAKVTVNGTLEMEEGVASNIDYRGHPHILKYDD
jgi:phage shock protein PspC (stress-responsive transcriptional regulator)